MKDREGGRNGRPSGEQVRRSVVRVGTWTSTGVGWETSPTSLVGREWERTGKQTTGETSDPI